MPFKAQKTHELVDGAKEWTSQKVRIVKAATKSKEAFQAAFNKERLQKSIAKMRGKRYGLDALLFVAAAWNLIVDHCSAVPENTLTRWPSPWPRRSLPMTNGSA